MTSVWQVDMYSHHLSYLSISLRTSKECLCNLNLGEPHAISVRRCPCIRLEQLAAVRTYTPRTNIFTNSHLNKKATEE